MLKIIQQKTFFSEIRLPDRNMLRVNNEVEIDLLAFPKHLNAPPKNRQRVHVSVRYNFNEFMNKEPFQIAYASCMFDIFTNRDVQLIELYRMVLSVTESLKTYVLSKNILYLHNEIFTPDPPDVVRAKLLPQLHRINKPQNDVLLN